MSSTYDRIGPAPFSHFGSVLVELAQIPQGARVLDVAGGRGASLIPAARRAGSRGRAVSIDLSYGMLREAAKEIVICDLQSSKVLRMDAEALAFPDASFDFVLCGFGLHLFPRASRALREFYRVLKPKGKLSVCTWAADCSYLNWLVSRFELYFQHLRSASSRADFGTRQALAVALEKAQFRVAGVTAVDRDFYYADEAQWWSSLWSYGFREPLESSDPLTLVRLKADLLGRARALREGDGVRVSLRALFAAAGKQPDRWR